METYTNYRAQVIKAVKQFFGESDWNWIIRQSEFSTWTLDNICANNWRKDREIEIAVSELIAEFGHLI